MRTSLRRGGSAAALGLLLPLFAACSSFPSVAPSAIAPSPVDPAATAPAPPEPGGADSPVIEVLAGGASPFSRPPVFDLQHPWSEPVRGVACRLTFPDSIRRGDRVRAILSFRAISGVLAPGTTHIDGRRPDRLLRLRLRNRDTGVTVEIRPGDPTGGMPDVPPPEGADPGEDPDRIRLADGDSPEWKAWFPTATAWEALVPGTWDAQVVIEAEPNREDPGAWSGVLATAPVPLAIEDAPPLRLRFRVPRSLRLRSWNTGWNGPRIGCSPEDLEPIALEVRNGFHIGAWFREGESIRETHIGGPYGAKDWTLLGSHYTDRTICPPIDREVSVEIFETAEAPAHLMHPGPGRGFFRVLWSRTFRVTATAAEIEALGR